MDKIKRFYSLDALRGIAALLVFIYHMRDLSIITNNIFINSAGIFVDLFFVLSGFVIYHNYKFKLIKFTHAKQFIVKRFKRLVPLHLYSLFIILLLEIAKYLTSSFLPYQVEAFSKEHIDAFFVNLFLLNSTPLFSGFGWNGQSWSISAEICCYLLFIMVSLYLFKNIKKTFITTFIIITACLLFYIINYGKLDIHRHFNFSFVRAFIGFFIGILTYLISQKIVFNSNKFFLFSVIELILITITVVMTCYLPNVFKNYFFAYHIIFSLVILIFSYEKGFFSNLFKLNVFQNIGKWSYSIYLNHIFMILIFNMIVIKLLKLEGLSIIIAELMLIILTCLYSKYTYMYIEKRFYKKL